MPAPSDDPSLEAMLRELEATDPVWTRVREKLGQPEGEKGRNDMLDGTNLTPDALLYYCEARLDDLDGQMNGIMDQQQTTNADEQALKDAIDALDQYSGDNQDLIDKLQTAAAEICDPATQAKLNALVQEVKDASGKIEQIRQQSPGASIDIPSSAIQNWTDTVKNLDSDLSSGAELNMIQLQSLMSERQVATQLTTNLVQALDDQLSKIVDNVGRA